jgi:cytochrome P450
MNAPRGAWPPLEGRAPESTAYTCDFVPVPAADMQDLARYGLLAVLHRDGPRTTIYCNSDHLGGGLARALSETATRYSRVTVRHSEPVSPRQALRFLRVNPDKMPGGLPPVALFTAETISYMAADQITEEMRGQLEEICAEETRYLSQLPVIAPAAGRPADTPSDRPGQVRALSRFGDRRPPRVPEHVLAGPAAPGDPRRCAEALRLLATLFGGSDGGDPYPVYRRIRDLAPVLPMPDGTLVLTRHQDVDDALRNPALGKPESGFGARRREVPDDQIREAMQRWKRTILFANPPHHTRLRRLISEAFTPRHAEALRSQIARAADEYLDRVADQAGADWISTVARPLPARIIAELLGIPGSDYELLAPDVSDLVEMFEPRPAASAVARGIAAQDKIGGYLAGLLAGKLQRPGDDLLSRLAASHAADALDQAEMVATAVLLFGAGFETTVNLLGNGLYALLTTPAQLRALRADLGRAGSAVDEMLRYDSPVQLTSRAALAPCEVAGTELAAGQNLLLLIGAANRDPARYDSPDDLNISRGDGPGLAFAAGAHFCLGAHLARLEAVITFSRLLTRFPRLQLVGEPRLRPGHSLRGFTELLVSCS